MRLILQAVGERLPVPQLDVHISVLRAKLCELLDRLRIPYLGGDRDHDPISTEGALTSCVELNRFLEICCPEDLPVLRLIHGGSPLSEEGHDIQAVLSLTRPPVTTNVVRAVESAGYGQHETLEGLPAHLVCVE
jgi:hypothetical protein